MKILKLSVCVLLAVMLATVQACVLDGGTEEAAIIAADNSADQADASPGAAADGRPAADSPDADTPPEGTPIPGQQAGQGEEEPREPKPQPGEKPVGEAPPAGSQRLNSYMNDHLGQESFITVDSDQQPTDTAQAAKLEELGIEFSGEAFLAAVESGELETVELLLAAGIHPDTRTNGGSTALMVAAGAGQEETALRLLAAGADAQARESRMSELTALHYAALGGQGRLCLELVKRGCPVDVLEATLKTPLFLAAAQGHGETCGVLLEQGADINYRSQTLSTPLIAAAAGGHLAVVEQLHGAGAELDAADLEGTTALLIAAGFNYPQMLTRLLELGADPGARLTDGRGAVHLAVFGRSQQTLELLRDAGVPLDEPNPVSGNTPLLDAAESVALELCNWLLDAGADPWQENNSRYSAADVLAAMHEEFSELNGEQLSGMGLSMDDIKFLAMLVEKCKQLR
jgi:ankyrin repeat protein